MPRIYAQVKMILVTSHRDVMAAFKVRLLFLAIKLEILCNLYTERCVNNDFENSHTSIGWLCDFLFDGCFVKCFQLVSTAIIPF